MSPRRYDPSRNPFPRSPRGVNSLPSAVRFTRQVCRSIERELKHPSWERAELEARKVGWGLPPADMPAEHRDVWRAYWLAMLGWERGGRAADRPLSPAEMARHVARKLEPSATNPVLWSRGPE